METMVHYKTTSELRALHRGLFFSRDTMRFWNSTLFRNVRTGATGWFVVTAENQFDSNLPRRYTVRRIDKDGKVETFGKFQEHRTFEGALDAATDAAREEREKFAPGG